VREPQEYIFSSASNYVLGTGVLDVELLDVFGPDIGYVHLGM
jgi:hypothetical protein